MENPKVPAATKHVSQKVWPLHTSGTVRMCPLLVYLDVRGWFSNSSTRGSPTLSSQGPMHAPAFTHTHTHTRRALFNINPRTKEGHNHYSKNEFQKWQACFFFFLKLLLKWARPSIPGHLLRAPLASFLIVEYVGTFFRPTSEALPCDQGQKDVQAETLRFCLWRLSHFFCSPNTIAAFIGLLCHLASSLP